ncbi:MAG: DNA repair protein RadA [Candidatus Melainabacteria bacterium]|jgi:DNA repair protein RadA/Sms
MAIKAKKNNSPGWFCRECGHESYQYLGKCPACNAWSSFVEQPAANNPKTTSKGSISSFAIDSTAGHAIKLSAIEIDHQNNRVSSGFAELDRVLGGGLQQGSFILIGGDPGIGKSTLLLQVMGEIARSGKKALYVSGEESAEQVKNRSLRLGVNQELLFMAETDLENVIYEIDQINPQLLIIDSIQAIHLSNKDSFPGSPSQIRDCASLLMQLAKKRNITTILVGHINKDGNIAGPKLLEHMVDVVLYFEGDKQNYFRIVRGIKNRFGPTDEVGLFEMTEEGLKEVANASSLFLSDSGGSIEARPGTAITATLQGSRVLLAEIQALTGYTTYAQPKRMVNGLDYNRASQTAAILERRIGLSLSKQDIYASVVGGLTIEEPSADLALCLAITSCSRNLALKENLVIFGEVGLTGEVRPVTKIELRLREAHRLGFKKAIIPNCKNINFKNMAFAKEMEICQVGRLSEALIFAFQKKSVSSSHEIISAKN